LPNPDIYGDFLDHLSRCYRANVHAWQGDVDNAIVAYREGRHFLQGATNHRFPDFRWWEANVRQQLDCCLMVVEHEDEAEIAACANFIKSRARTIDCAMEAG
jgi:hypothetical protein